MWVLFRKKEIQQQHIDCKAKLLGGQSSSSKKKMEFLLDKQATVVWLLIKRKEGKKERKKEKKPCRDQKGALSGRGRGRHSNGRTGFLLFNSAANAVVVFLLGWFVHTESNQGNTRQHSAMR